MINLSDKKSKWTLMKYIKDFTLMTQYAYAVRNGNADISDEALELINNDMEKNALYNPRFKKPSLDTINFKICQIVYYMFAYRAKDCNNKKKVVFSPLGNLLLDNMNNPEYVKKIFLCMLIAMPFNHPYNKMSPSFNLYPFRLIIKLLLDERLEGILYHDEIFSRVMFTKNIDAQSYEALVEDIIEIRKKPVADKLKFYKENVYREDTLANALHEWNYTSGILQKAGIINWYQCKRTEAFGSLVHGLDRAGKQSGRRAYKKDYISINADIETFASILLNAYSFDEKPHELLEKLGTNDYILQLYNFYPEELLESLGLIEDNTQEIILSILNLTEDIKIYAKNENEGDPYKFESVLCDAFNCFVDVEAQKVASVGTTDVECIFLPEDKKFDVEAKSTKNKLSQISAGRLNAHRIKIASNYTIIVTPYYVPAVLEDIKSTHNVIIKAAALANYLYQSAIISNRNIQYKPIHDIAKSCYGTDITDCLNQYVYEHFGVGVA